MINNSPTNPGNIVLVKFHFTGLIVGQIVPTKSLVDTTVLSLIDSLHKRLLSGATVSEVSDTVAQVAGVIGSYAGIFDWVRSTGRYRVATAPVSRAGGNYLRTTL